MIDIEYIASATGMGIIPYVDLSVYNKALLQRSLFEISKITQDKIKESCDMYDPSLSALFNAYTEEKFVERFKFFDNLNMRNMYADSGGLQMVTLGKTITPEIKKHIYDIQSFADYALCFDVIALKSITAKRTRNERSNVGNKVFQEADHLEAGTATGKNIKDQIEVFKKLGAKTKVIIIVQGNNKEDMLAFFNRIEKELAPEDYDHIGGIAVADTCIGSGELESVEMIRAAKKIADNCHPNIKGHLHILGVGSVYRMRPIIYLVRSGYISSFKHVSFDSSSHTSCFDYGLLKVGGTCRALGSTHNTKAQKHFDNVYSLYFEYFSKYVTLQEFRDIMFGTEKGLWKYSIIKKRGIDSGNEIYAVISYLSKAVHTFFQIHNFMNEINKLWREGKDGTPMSNLLAIRDEYDMNDWFKNPDIVGQLRSRRIKRASEIDSVLGMFE